MTGLYFPLDSVARKAMTAEGKRKRRTQWATTQTQRNCWNRRHPLVPPSSDVLRQSLRPATLPPSTPPRKAWRTTRCGLRRGPTASGVRAWWPRVRWAASPTWRTSR
ncbi:hypothetical protein ARTHRO8AJ_390107 [Arthrobacter sp. 8AJ]|nr:hypothetical protein ARTHRO8AJ_390107 [Arthrobacter sp. 8AJ]